MNDILNQEDLYLIVDEFYKKLLSDPSISYIFTEVVPIHLKEHLLELVTFWSQSVLGTSGYQKNVMQMHLNIHQKEKLTKEHFSTWLKHFFAAVDENFKGPNTEKIKTQAVSIATVMQIKIADLNK